MASSIARVQTDDRNVNQLQQNIIQAITPILKNGLVNGSILTGISLSPGLNQVPHGLGREIQGWIIVRLRASAQLYDSQDSNSSKTQTLALNASAACVVDLYVF